MSYIPSPAILKKYADVLIKFALWGGEGIKPNEVVYLCVPESSKPMLIPLENAVMERGAHFMTSYIPEGTDRNFYQKASQKQLLWTPKKYLLERVAVCDHLVWMISTNDMFELKGVDSKKLMQEAQAYKYYLDARRSKEDAGKQSWTLGLFGTEAMAKEAGMSLKAYWNQIIKACFLDYKDPIAKWKSVFKQVGTFKTKLSQMPIEKMHIQGKDVDLEIKIGPDRQWVGGSGRNIPSFEVFTSPDWRGTNGWVKFNQPLYRYGNLITGIELEFKNGRVVKSKASKNQKLLQDMIKTKNADKVGEFSLTDRRFSRITRFMADTLFDENVGGRFGNFHIALGSAYRDTFKGLKNKRPKTEVAWEKLGFNDSVVHTDIMSTSDRTVIATLNNGKEKVIYQQGQFVI